MYVALSALLYSSSSALRPFCAVRQRPFSTLSLVICTDVESYRLQKQPRSFATVRIIQLKDFCSRPTHTACDNSWRILQPPTLQQVSNYIASIRPAHTASVHHVFCSDRWFHQVRNERIYHARTDIAVERYQTWLRRNLVCRFYQDGMWYYTYCMGRMFRSWNEAADRRPVWYEAFAIARKNCKRFGTQVWTGVRRPVFYSHRTRQL